MLPAETTPRQLSGSTGSLSTFLVRREILGLRSSHIINIYSGSDLSAGDVSLGKVLMQHNGPSPPQNSGLYIECFQFFFKLWNIFRSSSLRVRPLRPGEEVCEIQSVEEQSWVWSGEMVDQQTGSWKARGWKLLLCRKLIKENWDWK